MKHQRVMILGAGKIGRGFVADVFYAAGSRLVFVDAAKGLIDSMNERGRYEILRLPDETNGDSVVIEGYAAYCTDDPRAVEEFIHIDGLALALFPRDFDAAADMIAAGVAARRKAGVTAPLIVYICTNTPDSKAIFRASLDRAADKCGVMLNDALRLAECIVIRMAVQPSAEQLAKDPLVVVTNGYRELIVDSSEIQDLLPDVPALKFTDRLAQDEERKLYTYNMLHALYAYLGLPKGLTTVYECTCDSEIQAVAKGALAEISQALITAYSYTQAEMDSWIAVVLKNMQNPILNDSLVRVGGDPVRKLKRHDRLTGAAMRCIENGVYPYFLSKALAGAFCFAPEGDPSAADVQALLRQEGVRAAARQLCSLELEPVLVQMIAESYADALAGTTFAYDPVEIALLKKAYTGGFFSEVKYRACCQALLINLFEIFGNEDPELFRVTTGFSGGMAITGDGVCGGYSGGILYMGKFAGRRLAETKIDGDKKLQYLSYEMSQQLHDLLTDTFGTVVCSGVHKSIFGQSYRLRTKPVRNAFEEAGAHTSKCTTVIAMSSMLTVRILLQRKLISAKDLV